MTGTCANGHPLTPANTYLTWEDGRARRRCAACERARERARYDTRHAGHHVIATSRRTKDGHPGRRCLTCTGPRAYYPPPVDEVVVLRTVQGDRPPRLTATERRAAIRQLHGAALSTRLIAERVGVTPRTVWRHLAAARAEAA